jgi:hypothetical protein
MTELSEGAVRDSPHRRAKELRPSVERRLAGLDHRPCRRFVSAKAIVAVSSGIAAAIAATVTVLCSSARPAFAGWHPDPTSPATGQVVAALHQCQRPGAPTLTDTRGRYTAAVYAVAGGVVTCLRGGALAFSGVATNPHVPHIASDQVQMFALSGASSSGQRFTVLDGRAGASVTAVIVRRSHVSPVRASLSHGWYVAWWPGTARATGVLIHTRTGSRTVALRGVTTNTPTCRAMERCGGKHSATASASPARLLGQTVRHTGPRNHNA